MKYIKVLLAITVCSLFTSLAFASPSTNNIVQVNDALGPWTFSLSGQGNTKLNNDAKVANSSVGAEFELGHSANIVLPETFGIRQGIGYSDSSGATWNFSTKAFADATIVKLGNLEFDAGVNGGISYGNQPLDWMVAPEAIVRLYLKTDVDVFGRVEYPFDITKGAADNNLVYSLGLRIRF